MFSANFLISSETTAKPLPLSPALAASILAFNASKFVCSAIPSITSTMFPIWLIFSNNISRFELMFWFPLDTLLQTCCIISTFCIFFLFESTISFTLSIIPSTIFTLSFKTVFISTIEALVSCENAILLSTITDKFFII